MAESSLFPTSIDSTNIYEVVARLNTTLTADISDTATTIPLASTSGFPTAGYIVIDNETIRYSSVGVGSVDATGGRGHAGTAISHTSGTQVLVAVTAAVFNKLRAGMIAAQSKIGISGSTDTNSIDYKLRYPWSITLAGSTLVSNLNAQYLGGSTEGQLAVGYIRGTSVVAGVSLSEMDVVISPGGWDLDNNNPATLGTVTGTSIAPKFQYLTVGATDQADSPPFIMPRSYNGQSIYFQWFHSNQTASQTFDIGFRGIGVANGSTYNPSYNSVLYIGTSTTSAISNVQIMGSTIIKGASLDWAAGRLCYLGIVGGTVTNNVRMHNVAFRWDKG